MPTRKTQAQPRVQKSAPAAPKRQSSQPHTPQESWNPRDAVSLFVKVSIEEWPEWVPPTGSHDAYMAGAKVTHNDKHWINEVDYNTYAPGVYGWREA